MKVAFTVYGVAQPAGSKRAFVTAGRARIVDDNAKSKPWKQMVAAAAAEAMAGQPVMQGPVKLTVFFWMPRPKAHYRADGTLRTHAPRLHTVKPDATKLLRGVEDSLSGVVWRDDSQVAEQLVTKEYAPAAAQVHVIVEEIEAA